MTKRAAKAAARARFRAAREGGRSALDDPPEEGHDRDGGNGNDDDIYEYVTEEQYRHIVESRRQREDFVVDDDGLGYHDDGEERFGDEAAGYEESQRKGAGSSSSSSSAKRSANAVLTVRALKKARRAQQAAAASKQEAAAAEAASKHQSMWNFVNRGSTVSSATAASAARRQPSSSSSSFATSRSVDDLLSALDDPLVSSSSSRRAGRKTRPAARRPRGGGGLAGGSSSSARAGSSHRHREPSEDEHPRGDPSGAFHQDDDDDGGFPPDSGGGGFPDDDDGGDQPMVDRKDAIMDVEEESPDEDKEKSSRKRRVSFSTPPDDDGKKKSAAAKGGEDDDDGAEEEEEGEAPKPVQRRRLLARPKLGQMSAPAAKAAEKARAAAVKAAPPPEVKTPTLDASIMASLPQTNIAAETGGASASSTAGQMELDAFLAKPEGEEGDPHLDMFWMDLCEHSNGDIFLFGKVRQPNQKNRFVSACVLVSGNVRNLFVLPRRSGEEAAAAASMMDVHSEVGTLLQKQNIVPRAAGASWAGKPVRRRYAFEDPDVPREEAEYLKVVYSAKYPVPSEEACTAGGRHFSKILGAGASVTENFVIKRKLMGPCWVRITLPAKTNAALTWCKLECKVDSPKQIQRLDLVEGITTAPPPPPVVSVSLKFKTVVNPKTHKSEIVSASAVCHKNVMLETASDESARHMTQLSLIRPLAVDGGPAQFPRDLDQQVAATMPQLRREPNERALLSRLFAQLGQWDPDVVVGHNAWGWDMEILLSRCIELKFGTVWSKMGRRRRTGVPNKSLLANRRDIAIAEAMSGRLLCDTYLSAKELLRETTYSLSNLAATQLKTTRQEIEPQDIPQYFHNSKTIVHLAQTTLYDAHLVQKLMFKLQVLPLTKQLTCIAGNLWSHTLKSNRAERTEYLLLHEFHRLKFLPPEKRRFGKKKQDSGKAKYSGGLVLEPKKGLYDSYILLLDFNSLYPSIIQEYNLCFTTVDWSGYTGAAVAEEEGQPSNLPPLPDAELERGVLPRVIQSLVDRRRSVKKILKNESNVEKREELDIRQKALKLTANSMYGCLGFSNSRFFAQPIAAMVTAMGRETLQRTVDIAQNTVGLDVIYGDTDSIMINTRVNEEKDLEEVIKLGEKVKREVNRLYKTLELEIDGIFRSMLLLKKKKYAAKTVELLPDGIVKYGQELKGLDLVRRDWCIQSKDTGRFVTEEILSGKDSEIVVQNIHDHLEELAKKMRSGELPLEKYTITKGLSKHPNDYPDGHAQPHVHVAKMLLKQNRPVNIGDHIPYVITAPIEEEGTDKPLAKAPSATERARHPEEIARSGGALKPDVEWYLAQQILPPVSRLCEPIEGTSQQRLAERLGLDSSRYSQIARSGADVDGDVDVDYTPASFLSDEERFRDVERFRIFCSACGADSEFPGVFHTERDASGNPVLVTGLRCTNPSCHRPKFWGRASHFECCASILNAVSIWVRGLSTRYYEGWVRCDEPSCGLETRQLSVAGGCCLARGCHGRMLPVDSEREVHTHLKYLESLFNVEHACEQLEKKKVFGARKDLLRGISKHDRSTYKDLHRSAVKYLEASAFNWISPSFWNGLFVIGGNKQ